MNKNKIYISGKISGLDIETAKTNFKRAEKRLKKGFSEVVNPMELSPYEDGKTWEQYMVDDIEALLTCDSIYMLLDWGQSRGARIEYTIAKEMNLEIYFETE